MRLVTLILAVCHDRGSSPEKLNYLQVSHQSHRTLNIFLDFQRLLKTYIYDSCRLQTSLSRPSIYTLHRQHPKQYSQKTGPIEIHTI